MTERLDAGPRDAGLRDKIDQLSPLARAAIAIKELRARLDAVERARSEPIAIVGMACRFPGGAHDPRAFWRMLRDGADGVIDVPPGRWDGDAYYDPDPAAPGKMYARRSGFLQAPVDRFDAGFFLIPPVEARSLDPQQRLLLELAWEALEDAGQPPDALIGTPTGVFLGIATCDHAELTSRLGLANLDPYCATGNANNIAAGRLAYVLGVRGPTLALDTACSSSLVALHLACRSLRSGECSLALVGGVNLMLTPTIHVLYARMGALAPDARCKAFDASADGMVRGEGGAVIVVKRLCDAERDGDRVLAVVRGTAVNHDGRSGGLTVPNGAAQSALIAAALADAGLSPPDLQFVEAHGTGTRLGDPIEANALVAALGAGRGQADPLVVGSAKANVGHLEAAAGLVGLIKAVQALRHAEIPPQLHFAALNPQIAPAGFPLIVPVRAMAWPATPGPRRAGVSSFGVSGTNAHAIVEAAPERAALTGADDGFGGAWVLPVSARAPEALRALAAGYAERLADPDVSVTALCTTAARRRAHLEHRLAVVGRSRGELGDALAAFLGRAVHPRVFAGEIAPGSARRVLFVFSGHGSHRAGMARGLLGRVDAFDAAIDACDAALARHGGPSARAELTRDGAAQRWHDVAVLQPVTFALQVALAETWRALGVVPGGVVGHSVGEIAAAHVCGALSLDDAARVVCRRSALLARLPEDGAMAVIGVGLERARAELAGRHDRVAIAVSNGRASTVVSGDAAAIDELVAAVAARGLFVRKLAGASIAGHSPQVAPLTGPLIEALAGIAPAEGAVPMFSTVTADVVAGTRLGPAYWARNLREPVLFAQAIEAAGSAGHDVFVELSPHPLLLGAIEQVMRPAGGAITTVASLRSDEPDCAALALAVARLHVAGVAVDWSALYPDRGRVTELPTYPWQRERYWIDPPPAPPASPAPPAPQPAHPGRAGAVFDRRFDAAGPPATAYGELVVEPARAAELAVLRLSGVALVPPGALLAICVAGAAELGVARAIALEAIAFGDALTLGEDEGVTLQLAIWHAGAARRFTLSSRSTGGAWATRVSGVLGPAALDRSVGAPAEQAARLPRVGALDDAMRARGVMAPAGAALGPLAGRAGDTLFAEVVPQPGAVWPVAPSLLDAMLAAVALAAADPGALVVEGDLAVPARIARLTIDLDRVRAAAWCGARPGDAWLADASGHVAVELEGIALAPLDRAAARAIVERQIAGWGYELAWPVVPAASASPGAAAAGRWLIFADRAGIGEAVARRLGARGEPVTLVFAGAVPASARLAGDVHAIDPADAAAYGALVRAPLRGVIHAWSADAAASHELTAASLARAQALGVGSVILLAQAAARTPVRLWLVTSGAQAIGGADGDAGLAVAQSPLWGLGKTLAVEHPELWGGLVDLDPTAPRDAVDPLIAEIDAGGGEDFVVLRAGARRAARLVRIDPPIAVPPPLALRGDAAYLVTGGLGGAGLELARWLVDRGARTLVLVGRRGLPARAAWPDALAAGDRAAHAIGVIQELEARGAEVEVVGADIAAPGAAADVIARIGARGRRLAGVLHAAGVVTPIALGDLTAHACDDILRPKVAGTWALHEATCDLALDFFVCFSSPAAVWGAAGLAAYAAANQFLDAWVQLRRARGLAAQSVNWGGWGGRGGMIDADVQRYAVAMGLGVMAPAQAIEALDAVIQSARAQSVIAPVDWRLFKPILESRRRRPLLAQIAVAERAHAAATAFLTRLAHTAPEDRLACVVAHVGEHVAEILGMTTPAQIDRRRGFFQMGMDSMMSVRLRDRLEDSVGRPLPPTLAFEHPNVDALAAYLTCEVLGYAAAAPDPGEPARPGGPLEAPAADLDRYSEDELAALLAAELAAGLDAGGAA